MRRILAIDSSICTVPVITEVQNAIEEVINRHCADVDAALEPWGLTSLDIVAPQYARVVYEDELPQFTTKEKP